MSFRARRQHLRYYWYSKIIPLAYMRLRIYSLEFIQDLNFRLCTQTEVCTTLTTVQKSRFDTFFKSQLISEWNFGVFKSPKKRTNFLTDLVGFWGIWRHQNFILRLRNIYHQPTKVECLESKFLVLWFFLFLACASLKNYMSNHSP